MIGVRIRAGLFLRVLVVAIATAGLGASVAVAVEPTKFVLFSQFGWKVDHTTGANICRESSKDECPTGVEGGPKAEISSESSGFGFPETVAVAKDGKVYVGDKLNHRVQEFNGEGEFEFMFGWDVNKTKEKEGAPQAERDVCTAPEVAKGSECGAGLEGDGSEGAMFTIVQALAVDQSTGDVYVYDFSNHRVDKFTAAGEFVWMAGGEVDETKDKEAGATEQEKNLCTVASHDKCKSGVLSGAKSTAHGAFKPAGFHGNLLAVGPGGVVYLGDEGRVQKLDPNGEWAGEISLSALSSSAAPNAIAVDGSGDMFVADKGVAGVDEYNAKGELQAATTDSTGHAITAIALDAYGRLGIVEFEPLAHGLIYAVGGTKPVAEFAPTSGNIPGGPAGLAFNLSTEVGKDPLADRAYVPEPATQAAAIYLPVTFPEVETCPAEAVGSTIATLCGKINPNGLLALGSFLYGKVGGAIHQTPVVFEEEGAAWKGYGYDLGGLLPNQEYEFAAVVEAEAEGTERQKVADMLRFHTTTPPPGVIGEPNVSFIKAQSAVLNGLVDPEHAVTHYHFEYGACPTLAGCATVATTNDQASSVYGQVQVSQEAQGLAADTLYSYRLTADNEHEEVREGKPVLEGGVATGVEGSFRTSPAPVLEAQTGHATGITPTSALISGSVNPDGQPAIYRFELGIYEGAATQYGIVSSGSTGTLPATESLTLAGLQPGTTYAFRIAIQSGYGAATGAPEVLVTPGLPSVLTEVGMPTQLPIPSIVIPSPGKATKAKTRSHHKPKQLKKKHKARKARHGSHSKRRLSR